MNIEEKEMKIQTLVETGKYKNPISYSDKIMLTGSCFSDEIGGVLRDYRFDTMVNPFGTMYNPASVCISLLRLGAAAKLCKMPLEISPFFTEKDIVKRPDGLYVTFFHHSSCGDYDAKKFLDNANEKLIRDAEFFRNVSKIIITLGTSWVFKYIGTSDKQIFNGESNTVAGKENPAAGGTGMIVANCHKLPAKYFKREFFSVSQTEKMLHMIVTAFPDKEIIFTVSPIRHMADGAHGNQVSKSSLLLAIDNLIEEQQNCREEKKNASYFPSYEIMMDELRDYRWYAEDMVHPSIAAVKYIFERFKESCISGDCYGRMDEELKKTKRENHRPLRQTE